MIYEILKDIVSFTNTQTEKEKEINFEKALIKYSYNNNLSTNNYSGKIERNLAFEDLNGIMTKREIIDALDRLELKNVAKKENFDNCIFYRIFKDEYFD